MSTSYRLSWGNSLDDPAILEVITTEKYRCLGPVQVAQDYDGRMGQLNVNEKGQKWSPWITGATREERIWRCTRMR